MVGERKERMRKCPITPALTNPDIPVKTPLSTSSPPEDPTDDPDNPPANFSKASSLFP